MFVIPSSRLLVGVLLVLAGIATGSGTTLSADDKGIPSQAEIQQLLLREPVTLETWPVWRERMLGWIGDQSRNADPAFAAGWEFVLQQSPDGKTLPPELSQDFFAWYLLGSVHFRASRERQDRQSLLELMDACYRKSLELEPNFARSHRGMGTVHLLYGRPLEAEAELNRMKQLDPSLSIGGSKGYVSMMKQQYTAAEMEFHEALREFPQDEQWALALAGSIVTNGNRGGKYADGIRPLVESFPQQGELACLHGLALAADGDSRGGLKEFERARTLHVQPEEILSPELVQQITEASGLTLAETIGYAMAGFVVVYAVIMALMAVAGVLLGRLTRGTRALDILGDGPSEIVRTGQVVQTGHESWLSRFYGVSLTLGLILFYVSVPFVVVGLLAGTGFALLLIFQLGRIPIKLVLIIAFMGLAMVWAVLKSLFAGFGRTEFGVLKTSKDCPQLHGILKEVAQRVDTSAVDQVYIVPGSMIGVHQQGRGPFGIFGVKARVLTLGISTLRNLTTSELKAILAHEYAHFSHRDTFYSRFIHQVSNSISQTLQGMGAAAGRLNYVNPFFWFMYLYYRSFSLLSSGFSRSREFLADRMAASLYGSDVFASGLTKVAVEGDYFEGSASQIVRSLLAEDKVLNNIYETFESIKNSPDSNRERAELKQKILDDPGSLYASHPTLPERFEAVSMLPKANSTDSTPAIQIFENPEAIETEMTQFLTHYTYYLILAEAQMVQG